MRLGFPALEKFERGAIAEGLVWTHRVIDMFPTAELRKEMSEAPITGDDLIELFMMRAMRTFDLAVQLRRTRRKNEERKAALLASQFELGSEFAAAIDLQGRDGEGHAVHQGIQEMRGCQRSGPFMHLQDIPAGDHVARGEVLQHYAPSRTNFFGVKLHQVTGLSNRPKPGLSASPRTAAHPLPLFSGCGERWCFDQHASAFQIAENATHHGSGKAKPFPAKQHHELVLAPARILTAKTKHALDLSGCPSRLSPMLWAMRAIFQASEVVRIVTTPPAIEGLATHAEMPAGERCITAILEIVAHPLQAKLGGSAQLAPKARQLSLLGYVPPSNLHSDTLPSVTNHSEREQEQPVVSFDVSDSDVARRPRQRFVAISDQETIVTSRFLL